MTYMSGATHRLGTDVVADVLKAVIAFGWEPAELKAMTQPGPSICSPGHVTSVDLGDESQPGADLVSALERILAEVEAIYRQERAAEADGSGSAASDGQPGDDHRQ